MHIYKNDTIRDLFAPTQDNCFMFIYTQLFLELFEIESIHKKLFNISPFLIL